MIQAFFGFLGAVACGGLLAGGFALGWFVRGKAEELRRPERQPEPSEAERQRQREQAEAWELYQGYTAARAYGMGEEGSSGTGQ